MSLLKISSSVCLYLAALFFSADVLAQKSNGQINGKIQSEEGETVPGVLIHLNGTSIHSTTAQDGTYSLSLPAGKHAINCSAIGFVKQTKRIIIQPGEAIELNFTLALDTQIMDEVTVIGKSALQAVKESPYNVVVIDTKKLENTSADISQALERSSGVRIKRSGGVGSNTSIVLNGFSGRHVKVFMDGVPMSGFGSAFDLNNIPVNFAERIEIYKGVVPLELGADALGGAINIVTKKTNNTYLDASYSYGSFNTHKTNINFGSTTKSGLRFNINAFQNYSDNNYKIKSQLLNINKDSPYFNSFSEEEYWFERFHNTYHNETIVGKVGVVQKKWADRLLLGVTLAQEKADIQNSNLMKIVYGGKSREASTTMYSLEYAKSNLFTRNLSFTLSSNYSNVHNTSTDTLARQYNWNGDYIDKKSKGEGDYSLAKFNNTTGLVTANLHYAVKEKHQFSINNVLSSYARNSSDEKATADNSSEADFIEKSNIKNVFGASYNYQINKKWGASLFGKQYNISVTGPVDTSSTTTAYYESQQRNFSTSGYGLVTNYKASSDVLIKVSFEKTVRLPTETELFGDEILETGTTDLSAENSRNINFNVSYFPSFGLQNNHAIYLDAGFIYRNTQDYIRRQIEQKRGGAFYTNHGNVKNLGVDMEARYYYKKHFSVGGNITYQNLRNMEKYDQYGRESYIYQDRMPNVPYLFGNAEASYRFSDVWGKNNNLTLCYYLNYVHEFFRSWESEGGDKITIPGQLSHDLNVTYSLKDGKYNVALEARNFTNTILYDNYSLQKPGRSFYATVRYFFSKYKN